ncbi:TonB-dependent receptor, partial [Escherichia coli]|nr:TonB-dependent receptor [Escherichia coli]
WSPRLGVLYQPNDSSSYYASYGYSYNTSGETYSYSVNSSLASPGNQRALNTPPEKSRNVEIGGKFDLLDHRLFVGAALFYSEKYNERNTDP